MKKSILTYILIISTLLIFVVFMNNKIKTTNTRTVVFWTLQLGTFDKYINKIIAEFEQKNSGIKIKWIDIPYSEGEKRTLASILTDNPPDLINVTPDFSLLLAQKNALEKIKKQQLEQFIPTLRESLKYNNEYFGIPFYATSAITLYNTELTNKEITNYDELFKIIPNNNSYITMINFTENDTLLKLLNKYNINTPDTINSKKSINLYTKLKELFDKNYIPRESITQTHREALEKYMAGQLAYLVTGANFLNMIKENAPRTYKKTKVLKQLVGETAAYDYSLMNFIIPKKAKNKKEALEFALFLTNKQNQIEFAKLTTILPVNRYSLDDEYFKNTNKNDIQAEARIISAKQLNTLQKVIPYTKNKKELNALSSNYIQEILINNKNIKNTLDEFSKDWKKL